MKKVKESVGIIKADGTWELKTVEIEPWFSHVSKGAMMQALDWYDFKIPEDVIDVIHVHRSYSKIVKEKYGNNKRGR